MSTQTENTAAAYTTSVWDLLPGVLWAALGMGVLAWWIWARDLAIGVPISLGTAVIGAGYLWLFLYATVRRVKAKNDSTALAAAANQVRPLLSFAGLAGGAIVVLLAAWLCLAEKEKLLVFGEVSSLAVLGLICIAGGLSLRLTPKSFFSRDVLLEKLMANRAQFAIVWMILGVGFAAAGGYFFLKAGISEWGIRFPGGPEGLGLFLIGLVLLGGGLYTQLTLDRPTTVDGVRMLALYMGSMVGLTIAVCTALRFYSWWNTYLNAGTQAWQGENSWRFWACAYVELYGLVKLFGSLLLARVDIRSNVSMRRLLYGYNAFLTGVLLLAMLVVLNIIIFVRMPSNIQWTASLGMHSLSDVAASTLEGLKQKVEVYVCMPGRMDSYQDMRDLLDNCQGVTNKLKVEFVSPDLDPARFRELAKKYPESLGKRAGGQMGGSGILIVYGDGPEDKKLPNRFVPDNELQDEDFQTKTRYFKGEQVLIQNITDLAEDSKKTKVYFTQFNGEIWINDVDVMQLMDPRVEPDAGAGTIASKLRKDNYEVQGLIWRADVPKQLSAADFVSARKSAKDKPEVPEDCKVLIIASPQVAFPKDALEAIDRYLDRGGNIILLARTSLVLPAKFLEDGVEELCKKINVQVANDFVVKTVGRSAADMLYVKANVPPNTTNKVARQFPRSNFLMFMPRTVQPIKGPGSYQADVILQVGEAANGGDILLETELPRDLFNLGPLGYVQDLRRQNKLRAKIAAEPPPVAVAVTDREGRARAIVFGDYGFITSDQLVSPLPGQGPSYDFFRSSVEWLSGRQVPVIGIKPKESKTYTLGEGVSGWRLILLPFGLSALALAGIGTGIWVVRRK